MFLTKKFFEQWVEKNIGLKDEEETSRGLISILWPGTSYTLRQRLKRVEEKGAALEERLLKLTEKLGLEYKTTESKKVYFKKPKQS